MIMNEEKQKGFSSNFASLGKPVPYNTNGLEISVIPMIVSFPHIVPDVVLKKIVIL